MADFRTFVEHTEKELYKLFLKIDKDKNGRLDKEELERAFKSAGLQMPQAKLNQFFTEVDHNQDVG